YLATTNTLLQLVVEDSYRGRMMGLHTVMFLGTQPLGSLVLGALAQRFGAPRAALVSGGVSLAAAGWLALRLRRVALRERAAAGWGSGPSTSPFRPKTAPTAWPSRRASSGSRARSSAPPRRPRRPRRCCARSCSRSCASSVAGRTS